MKLFAAGFLVSLLILTIGSTAWAGYTTTQLTDNSADCNAYAQLPACFDDSDPRINDSGQVVWSGLDGKGYDHEIFLYSGGVTTQLTDNDDDDRSPQINNSGQVVWNGSGKIFLYSGGVTTQLTDVGLNGQKPQINDTGQVVWTQWDGTDSEIFLYSGGFTTQLTDNGSFDGDPQMNNAGQVVWCGWGSLNASIFLFSGGVITNIATGDFNYAMPQINNSGQVVWSASGVFLYDDGTTSQLSGNAYHRDPQINDSGQVVWFGWGTPDYNNEIFLYSDGVTTQLTDSGLNDQDPQINDAGQVVWFGYNDTDSSIFLYSGGAITQLAGSNGGNFPQINGNGQVVWMGWDGTDWEVYLAKPCQGERPSLSRSRAAVYWASYADYLGRSLSVDYEITNTGDAIANDVRITSSTATNGVTLTTPVPATVGNLDSGSGVTRTLEYHVPAGVIRFMATVNAEANDGCGNSYSYP